MTLPLAIEVGMQLCEKLLEPLQRVFGRVAIRSAYRSCEVNALGNAKGHNCADNKKNYAHHIWDRRSPDGMGATACIVLPEFFDAFSNDGDWTKLAWWIHDNLPYGSLEFFKPNSAFNLQWHENPQRSISSYAPWLDGDTWKQRGYLTRTSMANHAGDHRDQWHFLTDRFPDITYQTVVDDRG
jgi:hypothetical protein